jgi:transposase-like protein
MEMTMNDARNGAGSARVVPDPQVPEKAQRRRFTAEYKLRVLAEAEGCTEPGQIGALLRREGLYWSNLQKWRTQRRTGVLRALSPKKRGPKPQPDAALIQRLAELERHNEQLQRRLERAEKIIEVQKKVADLLGLASLSEPTGGAN